MLTTVATFTEPWEAHLFAGRLKAEGLAASIAHEYHVWNVWSSATALHGVKVQVPESEADAARAVWQACRSGEYYDMVVEEFGAEPDGFKCPACGSIDLRSWHTWTEVLTSLVSLFFGAAILPAQPSGYRCKQCGARWTRGPVPVDA